jgi:beta-lactamase regulating signal transducer with metallopeptidase domain
MTLQMLLSNSAAQTLGTALLHFVWQGFVLALLLRIFFIVAPGAPACLRYAIGCAILLAMPVTMILTPVLQNLPADSLPSTILSSAPATLTQSSSAHQALAAGSHVSSGVGPAGWAVALWLVGIFALALHSTAGWIRAQRLKYRGTAPADPVWTTALEQLMRRLGITRPVRLCTSAIAEVPTVVGWIRPFILLPVSALSGLGPREIEAILAHELAHIRRHDYLVNLLQTAIETLLFYHPAVWWVSRQIRREREHCCDDVAVMLCGDVKLYAGALAQLEEHRGRALEPALAATGGELLGRIRRLLQPPQSGRRIPRFLGAAIAAAVVLGAIGVPAMLLLNAAPQQPAPVSIPSPATAPNTEPALTVERPLAIGRDARVAFREAQDLIRGVRVEQGKLLIDNEPKRVPTEAGTDMLIKLYDTSKDLEVKRSALNHLSDRDGVKAAGKVRSVAQSDPNPELRREAVGYLAEHAKSFDELVSLFDNARDADMRITILDYLAESSDPRVLDKLFSIAQSDGDVTVRRLAVDYIAER